MVHGQQPAWLPIITNIIIKRPLTQKKHAWVPQILLLMLFIPAIAPGQQQARLPRHPPHHPGRPHQEAGGRGPLLQAGAAPGRQGAAAAVPPAQEVSSRQGPGPVLPHL